MASREVILEQELKAAETREAALLQELVRLQSQIAAEEKEKQAAKQAELALNEELTRINAQILTIRSNFVGLVAGIRKIVHDFMANVKEFQTNLQDFDKISANAPSCKLCNPLCNCKHEDETAALESMPICIDRLLEVTQCAKSGLTQATKDWKNAQGRVEGLTVKARKCFLHTILGKKHTYTLEFANPKAIDFRIQPHPLETQPKKKFKSKQTPGTGKETNQNKPAVAASGSSSNDGVQANLDT